MKLQRGTPTEEGRYVAFVRCESYQVKGWLEPEIATFAGGRWHNARHVFAWIGPLPVCKWADFKGPTQEYDPRLTDLPWKPAQEYDL